MTVNELLQQMLKSQELSSGELETLTKNRDEVETLLREKFGEEPTIKYAGSKAKGTMIKENFDLDVICYFPRDCERDIEEIYKDVSDKLSEKYVIEPKASALRIHGSEESTTEVDYHIDVVPGRFVDEKEGDTFLYLSSGEGKRIKTNLDVHIKYISGSSCVEIIRLVKLWKVRNYIKLKTFILELLVIQFLKGSKTKENSENAFEKVLECLRDDILDIRLEDPANTNNVVSEGWNESERRAVSSKAKESLDLINIDDEDDDKKVERWKEVFKETSIGKRVTSSIIIDNPPKPWCSL